MAKLRGNTRVATSFFEITDTSQKQIDVGFKPDFVKFEITSTNGQFNTDKTFNGEEFGWGHGVAKIKNGINNIGITEGHGSSSTNGMAAASSSSYSLYQVITANDGNGINGWVEGYVTSASQSGFTIDFDSVDKTPLYAQYTAYKLSRPVKLDIGTTTLATSQTTNKIKTGFHPNYTHIFAQTNPSITGMDQQTQKGGAQSGWTLGWAQRDINDITQTVMSNNMFVNNIDDHNWAASDQDIIYIPEAASKSGVTGVTKASINFVSDGFELDYSDPGAGQPAIYISAKMFSPPEVGYAFTPTATGPQTVDTNRNFEDIRIIGSNTITGINTDEHVGREQHGFMFGNVTSEGQHSMGFSSNSDSVNGHSSGSRDGNAFHLLYTDQNGNIEAKETATVISKAAGNLTLDWSSVATTSSTSVGSTMFVYIGYPKSILQTG